MTNQDPLLEKRPFSFPNIQETVYILRSLRFWEKLVFFFLAIFFIISFIILVWKINDRLLVVVPEDGGQLVEGVVGAPRFINPLISISDAERDLSALFYSGLMRSDNKSNFVNDLAENYEISEDGLTYTFTLKPNLFWHDGEKLTTEDIVFTIQKAKDPILKSNKRATWDGVSVEKINDQTIKFTLKKPYSPFLENMAMGILPKHIWQNIPSEQFLFSEYNVNPVGSGPYKIETISRDSSGNVSSYKLVPFDKFALGKPHLENIEIKFFLSEKEAVKSYTDGGIESLSGISASTVEEIKNIISAEEMDSQIKTVNLPRTFAIFFNQNKSKVLLQKEVRQALSLSTDKNKLVNEVLKGYGKTLEHPIPEGTLGHLEQEDADFSVENAKKLLTKNGWQLNENTKLLEKKLDKKETISLQFSISTSADSEELKNAASLIKQMWEEVGAKVEINLFETGDLQNVIAERNYESLLFGTSIGHDPDPFVFWHSSQKNYPGSNVSLYANSKVDKLLEDARKILNQEEKIKKYQQFQEEIEKDVPAIFLFSPSFVYIMPNKIKGIEKIDTVAAPSERFAQVHNWYVYTTKIWRFFVK